MAISVATGTAAFHRPMEREDVNPVLGVPESCRLHVRLVAHRPSAWCPPPAGRDASHAARSSGRYLTAEFSLMNFGPCRRSRQRRTDATDKLVMRATSCS